MITNLLKIDSGFEQSDEKGSFNWIRAIDPNAEEQEFLREEYAVDGDFIHDVHDFDEQSRIERDSSGIYVIIRVPLFREDREIDYFTVPLGLVIRETELITICLYEIPILQDLLSNRIRGLDVTSPNSIILNIILRSIQYYLRYLKDMNRKSLKIEQGMHKAIINNELSEFMTLQKSLVYFTTSLRANEMLLEKIKKLAAWQLTPDEQELLEDVQIEQRQASEMARIYTNILTATMGSFTSIISNNLSVVMKRLTIVSLTLMIPTLIASLFGMNVPIPGKGEDPTEFIIIASSSIILAFIGFWVFRARKLY